MLRIGPRAINYGHWDCSARDSAVAAAQSALSAAQAAEDQAQEEYDNARELDDALRNEQKAISDQISNYDNVFSAIASSGKTFLTTANVDCIRSGFKCLNEYKNSVDAAKQSAAAERKSTLETLKQRKQERKQCEINLQSAQNIPCNWVDTPRGMVE